MFDDDMNFCVAGKGAFRGGARATKTPVTQGGVQVLRENREHEASNIPQVFRKTDRGGSPGH
jgi:hypothetical protein